jgi:hypothetical protein
MITLAASEIQEKSNLSLVLIASSKGYFENSELGDVKSFLLGSHIRGSALFSCAARAA